jgi:peptidase inhibitor family I36
MVAAVTAVVASAFIAVPAQASASVRAEVDTLVQRGATRISPTVVSWHDGSVILDLAPVADKSSSVAAPSATVHNCPAGWYCFYQYSDWGGRRLQFHDCSSQGIGQSFYDYDFEFKTSSWVQNRSNGVVSPYEATGDALWNEYHNSSSSRVSADVDNAATGFTCDT